jgi:tRNA/rRNA methyltransferase
VVSLRIVLVRPASPANVGAVARIVMNMGLAGMDLVAAGDYRTVECWRTAWGATRVLDQAREYPELSSALRDAAYAVGFTRRNGDEPALDVRDASAQAATLGAAASAAFVFGPESSGLTLDELACCGRRAFIPSHPDQPSLNLSHAALIAAYEFFRAGAPPRAPRPRLCLHAEKQAFLELLASALQGLGAISPARRRVHLRSWSRFIQRADVTPSELRMLTHLARRLTASGPRESSEPSDLRIAYEDVEQMPEGFSIPELKWRELLFIGAVRKEGETFVRDASRPLPPFRIRDLFAEKMRYKAVLREGRVELRRCMNGKKTN